MTFEVEVPLRQRTIWPAFTDPEKTARAVPGLIVDAVHPVPAAEGSDGVAGDVVAGRLKLRVGAGASGAVITYRGTGCIASASAAKGTLDIAVDAAQARGNGALAGYLRITLAPAGEAGERTLISVVPELELSGRALEFAREHWHAAVTALAAGWVEALTAGLVDDAEAEPAQAEPAEADPARTEPAAAEGRQSFADPEAISEDPLEPIWQGRYEKNRWLPVLAALTLFLLIARRRRHRTDPPGADSSFRME